MPQGWTLSQYDNEIMVDRTLKIGVIGGGISGITAAWLLSRRHSVTLIEKEPQLGGYTYPFS